MKQPMKKFAAGARHAGLGIVLAALVMGVVALPVTGCTQQQKVNFAQEIVNWTPALTSAVNTAGAVVASLDPAGAPVVATVVTAFDALAPQFQAAAKNYLANPSQTTLQELQALIVQMQNATNAALLNAVHIVDPAIQQKVEVVVNGIATVVNSLLALIQGVSTKTQVAAMSRNVTVHLAQVEGELDKQGMRTASLRISRDIGVPAVSVDRYLAYEAQAGF